MTQIQSTKDYKRFKNIQGNRAINFYHVNRLVSSISKRNLLEFNPIIVNEKFEVIDGMHRLKAAETLQTDIYYVIAEGTGLNEVQALNSEVRRWTMAEFVDSYIAQGLPDYQVLKDFATENDFSLSNAMLMLSGNLKNGWAVGQRIKLKNGEWKVLNLDYAENFAKELDVIRPYVESKAVEHDRDFMQALAITMEKVDMSDFHEQLEKTHAIIRITQSRRNYLHQFEDVINYGRSKTRIAL